MKTFFHKHKIVLIAMALVLCVGALSGLGIAGIIRISMGGRTFETVAEAKTEERPTETPRPAPISPTERAERPAEQTPEPVSTPAPSPTPEPPKEILLSANEIKTLTQSVQNRRRYIIPIRTENYIPDNRFLWEEIEPDATQRRNALNTANELTRTIFGESFAVVTGYPMRNASVRLFTDPTGDREAFFRVADPNDVLILFMRASDGRLICADLLTYPEREAINRREDCERIARALGYDATHLTNENGTEREIVYLFRAKTGACLSFSYCGDKLWQVAVYPSTEAMIECEYFLADIQLDYSVAAYPEKFVEARPPSGSQPYDMLYGAQIITKLDRLNGMLTGVSLERSKIKATFYRDESGAREDCWKIVGADLTAVVSAYSRNVISMECNIPCKTLADIPYEEMGNDAYLEVAELIGRYLFTGLGTYRGDPHGKTVTKVMTDAIYDYHACTMSVELEDGTFYELVFKDGVLVEIRYYPDESFMIEGGFGWVADHVYVNAATGRKVIPGRRDWDGEFFVIRHEN